jgi:hypothetical protein
MAKSSRPQQQTNDKLLLLVEQQKESKEGSQQWHTLQEEINQIIAENFLQYVNR